MSTMNYSHHDRSFNRISGIFWVIFTFAAIIIITVFGIVILAGIKGCQEVGDHGLKGVVESVWNGPTNGVGK